MPSPRHPARHRAVLLGTALLAVAACGQFDMDFRNNGADTSQAARTRTAPRPQPDNRGLISYPGYQVALARRGDTVADVAARVGLPAAQIARYNGIPEDVPLRQGELLALPARVSEPSPETGAIATGPIQPADNIDITTLAGNAIERAGGRQQATATPADGGPKVPVGPEPVRHKVQRGETAFSIARLYNVSVRALADWNGLGPDLTVREGQYLLIPVPAEDAAAAPPPQQTSRPGAQSPVPTPPSAAEPLPKDEKPAAAQPKEPLPSPDLQSEKTVTSQLAFPVSGKIIRGFEKGKNEGIDISASAGTPVKAADDGTVAAITRDTEKVPILVIRHSDNLLTVYANIDGIKVEKGDSVTRGQTVAAVRQGDPAFLHFEVRRGFESVDPMPFLN